MRVGLDFDRVVFDTESFDEYFKKNTDLYHVDEDVYDENGNYSPEKHAEACGVDIEEVYEALRDLEQFLYDDIREIKDRLREHELVIVTRGQERFQRMKVEASGAMELFDDVEFVESGPKSQADVDVLIDDLDDEINDIEIPGFLFDREKHSAEDIIKFVRAEEVFKRYDVRGNYPEQINRDFARNFGKAIATFVVEEGGSKLAVSRDNKDSSGELKQALIEGARSAGVDVVDVGIGPTDYAAYAGVKESSHSVQVTSSHLPLDTNGFKMMYPEGNGFVNEDLDRVRDIFRRKDFEEGTGELIQADYSGDYREEALAYVEDLRDVSGGRIVYESMGGAGSVFVPELLEELGFDVIDLSKDSDGPRIDPPNPKPELLEHVEDEVEETDARIGLANDMDADRVALYFDGEWIDGNTLFAVFAQLVSPERIVASIDTSQAVEDSFGGEVSYTRVGDPFVIDETLDFDAELSGEPNGHYCFTGFVPYNSGTVAALILSAADLDRRIDEVPEFHNMREPVKVENKEEKMESVIRRVEDEFEIVSRADGVCYRSGDSRVLIRPSGSSPKIRAIVDSGSEDGAQEALDEAVEIIENA